MLFILYNLDLPFIVLFLITVYLMIDTSFCRSFNWKIDLLDETMNCKQLENVMYFFSILFRIVL